MRPFLIFGANGQVGQALLSASETGDCIALARYECDITQAFAVASALKWWRPSAVINCAVYRDVDKAEVERDEARRVNTEGVETLAQRCAEASIPLVHLSSDYAESAACWFGATKLGGEAAVRSVHPHHLVLRTSWLYGPHGRNFLKTILTKAEAGETLRVVNDQVGTPTHTEDLAKAIIAATERLIEDPSVSGIYNFAGADPCSWFDFAREIVVAAGLSATIDPITTEESGAIAKRPAYSALDSSKFTETFGVTAEPRAKRMAETIAALRR